jgi:hypothetical protein
MSTTGLTRRRHVWVRVLTSQQLVRVRLDLVVELPTPDRLIDGDDQCHLTPSPLWPAGLVSKRSAEQCSERVESGSGMDIEVGVDAVTPSTASTMVMVIASVNGAMSG